MESLYILVPLSVVLVLVIGWVFWRALECGQFDDLERPALEVLMDDDSPPAERGGRATGPPTASGRQRPV
jgi:cbb3-type cytochrome oxidase maturation protein